MNIIGTSIDSNCIKWSVAPKNERVLSDPQKNNNTIFTVKQGPRAYIVVNEDSLPAAHFGT